MHYPSLRGFNYQPSYGRTGLDLWIEHIEPLCDVLSIHPYYTGHGGREEQDGFRALLDEYAGFAAKAGKPILATETCWGALDDAHRVAIIRFTLAELNARDIGFLAYLLHHSRIADAHRPAFGPVGTPGNLSFIEADGRLRSGHGIFNEF